MSASSAVSPELDSASTASLGGDHAEIAVARLAGMDELRRRAGRGEGRGDLARDMAALAHAADDDAARHRGEQLDRRGEAPSSPSTSASSPAISCAAPGARRRRRRFLDESVQGIPGRLLVISVRFRNDHTGHGATRRHARKSCNTIAARNDAVRVSYAHAVES